MAGDPEEWRTIEGWPRYEVSSEGRVRNAKTGRILKLNRNRSGYTYCGLSANNRTRTFTVHRLVALTFFVGPIAPGMEANHDDGDKPNCRASNLAIVTASANMQHAIRTGLYRHPSGDAHWTRRTPERLLRGDAKRATLNREAMRAPRPSVQGSKNHAAKLSAEDVREIRRAFAAKEKSQGQLAKTYGVAQPTISQIVRREKWASVA
ncbi:MAG: HNH endonuclease [Hyphomonadaceae bacterium]|nr:HNH endonuclease [Hyphomonadaceae bacterium]